MKLSLSIRIVAFVAATAMMLLGLYVVLSVTAWGSEWFGGLSPLQQYWIPKLTLAVSLFIPAVGIWLNRRQRNADRGAE